MPVTGFDSSDVSKVPLGWFRKKRRQVVNEMRIGKERIDPFARHPAVIDVIGIRPVFGLPARWARQVIEEGRIDSMTTKPEVRWLPALSHHMVSADHDLIDVFDHEVSVMKSVFAVHPRERRRGVQ